MDLGNHQIPGVALALPLVLSSDIGYGPPDGGLPSRAGATPYPWSRRPWWGSRSIDGGEPADRGYPHRCSGAPVLCRASPKMKAERLTFSPSQVVVGRVRRWAVVSAQGRRTLRSSKRRPRELAGEVLGEQTRSEDRRFGR